MRAQTSSLITGALLPAEELDHRLLPAITRLRRNRLLPAPGVQALQQIRVDRMRNDGPVPVRGFALHVISFV